jgi:outer membrane protein OmpA-like peptidoglycan-associated protein
MVPAQTDRAIADSMRNISALTAVLAIAALSCANAQSYPGEEVTVNPGAAGQTLIDPGTGQPRYVPPLLEPGTTYGPIRLHRPVRHRHAAPATSSLAAPSETVAEAPPPPVHKTRKARDVPAPRTAPTQPMAGGNLGDLADLATESKPPEPRVIEPKPVERKPAPKPTVVASVPKAPERTTPKPAAAMGKARDVVLFAAGATDPSTSALSAIHTLAGSLNGAMADGNSRVQLLAYGGPRGEKSSDTRRLSLKRALIVRQLLIDDGIPAERIDVRALGGVDDDGPLDRVDVFLKS